MSAFDSSADLQNFGPNITLIFVPGALNCSNPVEHQYNLYFIILEGDWSTSGFDWYSKSNKYWWYCQEKARQVNTKQFRYFHTRKPIHNVSDTCTFSISLFWCSIEVSQELTEDVSPEEVEPQYDCGKSVCIISLTLYLAMFDPRTKSKSKLSGETKYRGRGLWLGTPQEFCKWRQSKLLLAFLCRITSNILEQINFKIWFINLNLINLRATSTGDASFYSQNGIFHLALTIPRKENAAGYHKICTFLQGGKNFTVFQPCERKCLDIFSSEMDPTC